MKLNRMVTGAGLLVTLSIAPVVWAEEQAGKSSEEALQLAEKAWERVLASDYVSFEFVGLMETRAEGMEQDMESRYEVHVGRPDRLALLASEGDFAQSVISDGGRTIFYFPAKEKYLEREAVGDFDILIGMEEAGMMGPFSATGSLAPFLSRESYQKARNMVTSAEYLGKEERGDDILHRLLLQVDGGSGDWGGTLPAGTELDFQLEVNLVERGGDLLVDRVHIDLTEFIRTVMGAAAKEQPEMAEVARTMEMSYTLEFGDWKFPETISPDVFVFDPPAEAERIEGPEELFAEGQEGGEASALLGQPAPTFELQMLDGTQARLEDHLGEKVIVLDFWATWCGPCIHAMPILMDVTGEYEDDGVLFWAINLREEPQKIREFMEARDWDLNVPLDPNGQVGNLFLVTGIPQTVIIGKDGTVQAVHIGFSPRLRETLPEELETLLEGGSLLK